MDIVPTLSEMNELLSEAPMFFYPEKPLERKGKIQFKRSQPYSKPYQASCPQCHKASIVRIVTNKNGLTKTHTLLCENRHVIVRQKKYINPLLTGLFKPEPANDHPLF